PRSWSQSCAAHYHNARCHAAFRRDLLGGRGGRTLVEIGGALHDAATRPWRVLSALRGSRHVLAALGPRLFLIALSTLAGRCLGAVGGAGTSPARVD
ncbi:MAG: hypothetical protein ACREQQ_17275, partial [Candidatus Binatia bacterium]